MLPGWSTELVLMLRSVCAYVVEAGGRDTGACPFFIFFLCNRSFKILRNAKAEESYFLGYICSDICTKKGKEKR